MFSCEHIPFDRGENLFALEHIVRSLKVWFLVLGISKIKSPAVKAFKATHRGQRFYLRESEGEIMSMTSMETVTDVLLEIMEVNEDNYYIM
jgi:hypothetical protein